jgi:hypothetical protein
MRHDDDDDDDNNNNDFYVHAYIQQRKKCHWYGLSIDPSYSIIYYGNIIFIYIFFIVAHFFKNTTKV